MAKRKIKICECCQTNPVKNQRRSDCKYCNYCAVYLWGYHTRLYQKLKIRLMKKLKK